MKEAKPYWYPNMANSMDPLYFVRLHVPNLIIDDMDHEQRSSLVVLSPLLLVTQGGRPRGYSICQDNLGTAI